MIKKNGPYQLYIYREGSDFNDPVVQVCRGIILKGDKIVCAPFYKFGNFYENYVPDIDWSSARVEEKLDGSIIKFWYDDDKWHCSSNTSIDYKLNPNVKVDTTMFNKENTYIFELIGRNNKVRVPYVEDELVHIGIRNNLTLKESNEKLPGYKLPRVFDLHTLDECLQYLEQSEEFLEGFVVIDKNWNRLKIKSKRYLEANVPTKKEVIKNLLFEIPMDDYPPGYFAEEEWKVANYKQELRNGKFLSYTKRKDQSMTEHDWISRNIDKIIAYINKMKIPKDVQLL